jgi:hypothetical protein
MIEVALDQAGAMEPRSTLHRQGGYKRGLSQLKTLDALKCRRPLFIYTE